jgi:hypothetical protein
MDENVEAHRGGGEMVARWANVGDRVQEGIGQLQLTAKVSRNCAMIIFRTKYLYY